VGQPAPPVTGTTLDGAAFDLAALRGRPVILNFWASWCGPCRNEFPLLQDRLDAHEAEGLAVVGVLYKDEPEPAREFVGDFGATWPTVLDPTGELAKRYLLVAPPQSYFIDRNGVVQALHIGEILGEDFEALYPKIAS
jgi:cytochrome c biogenesis protein CcmG, thiol:disulfide interchange protein DsbE